MPPGRAGGSCRALSRLEEEPAEIPLILRASWESSPLPFAGRLSPNWALKQEPLAGATSLQSPSSGA